MTTEDLANLTPEEKRIRIAKIRGWTQVRYKGAEADFLLGPNAKPKYTFGLIAPTGRLAFGADVSLAEALDDWGVPDYLNDLNAIAGARSGMTPEQRADYVAHLWDALGLPREPHSVNFWTAQNTDGFFACIDAPADKHCDAFLITLG